MAGIDADGVEKSRGNVWGCACTCSVCRVGRCVALCCDISWNTLVDVGHQCCYNGEPGIALANRITWYGSPICIPPIVCSSSPLQRITWILRLRSIYWILYNLFKLDMVPFFFPSSAQFTGDWNSPASEVIWYQSHSLPQFASPLQFLSEVLIWGAGIPTILFGNLGSDIGLAYDPPSHQLRPRRPILRVYGDVLG
jgi:hypothetical protein